MNAKTFKYIIMTPSFNEINGGVVVLHKLCHTLNELGEHAYLFHYRDNYLLNSNAFFSSLYSVAKNYIKILRNGFKVNESLNTPIIKSIPEDIDTDNWVVIYPEVVLGNPLRAKNVVRWLLHQPGFHNGNVLYGQGELYFKFNSAIYDFHLQGSVTSPLELKVIHYPLEHYNQVGVAEQRSGTAYCIRKGRGKPIVHDLKDSILIDGMSHADTAKVFKSVKRFISYDTLTAYSIFAVLCGCESVVIPDDGITKEQWYPNAEDRYGIAYGLGESEVRNALETSSKVLERVQAHHLASNDNVKKMIQEIGTYFA
ncbi:WavQ [Shewanella algae]|uniref:WavQ n=1 Tax=Shewanella algae TaxID=38313 RepID=UPI0016563B46|nr:WavQ [Shewanella algae]MBC8796428.1 WavQ [Shewanella algae]